MWSKIYPKVYCGPSTEPFTYDEPPSTLEIGVHEAPNVSRSPYATLNEG